jgi:hypothetical protein
MDHQSNNTSFRQSSTLGQNVLCLMIGEATNQGRLQRKYTCCEGAEYYVSD